MYILPCLYGFIGSSIATFRYMGVRVDEYLLNFTDRSVFIQNGILGIIAGVVVGLFASALIPTTGTTAALSLSAIAFLAGYSVSGLFAFFDNISTRIFQGLTTPGNDCEEHLATVLCDFIGSDQIEIAHQRVLP